MKTKVLIAETNRALADMWCTYLNHHEMDAAVFIQDETTPEKLKEWGDPNIIISGLEPDNGIASTGTELCTNIYGEEKPLNPPVIQLHASHLSDSAKHKVKAKTFMLIQKPLSMATLLEAVQKASFELLFSYYRDHHSSAMTAELKGDAIVGILQYIDASKRSGIILVKSETQNAYISFSEGKPVDAQYTSMTGTEAVYEILSWKHGEGSFFESDIPENAESTIPEIPALLTEKSRQAEEIKQSQQTFDDPGVYIFINCDVDLDPVSPSGRIYANLAKEKTLAELMGLLSDLTYRQIMITLSGMLMRDEIQYSNKAQKDLAVSEKICKDIIDAIKGKKAADVAAHPVTIGVYSGTPQLAKKFIGAICSKNIAGNAVINAGNNPVIVSELPKSSHGIDFFDITASILVFDKADTEHLPNAVKFIQEVRNANSNVFIVAELSSSSDESAHTSHLLGIQEDQNLTASFEWQPESCLAVIDKVFTSIMSSTA